jgi:hypothetical protein
VKDVVEIKIDRIESRDVGKTIERFSEPVLLFSDKGYDLVDFPLIEDSAWSPDKKLSAVDELNIGRETHDACSRYAVPTREDAYSTRFRLLDLSPIFPHPSLLSVVSDIE